MQRRGARWAPLRRGPAPSERPFGPPSLGARSQAAGQRLRSAPLAIRRNGKPSLRRGLPARNIDHGDFARAATSRSPVSSSLWRTGIRASREERIWARATPVQDGDFARADAGDLARALTEVRGLATHLAVFDKVEAVGHDAYHDARPDLVGGRNSSRVWTACVSTRLNQDAGTRVSHETPLPGGGGETRRRRLRLGSLADTRPIPSVDTSVLP